MKHSTVTINGSSPQPPRQCVVLASATLADVVEKIDTATTPYILVEDDEGQLIGIVETQHIVSRLRSRNDVERERWRQTQIEAALQWKLSPKTVFSDSKPEVSFPMQCTAVASGGDVVALVSDQDIFVSWEAVRDSLAGATVDVVTALPNRLLFERRLNEEIGRAAREEHSIAVILVDIDYFKQVNDLFGHKMGDTALEAVADLLSEQLRSYDVITRYGGDEFAALCCGCKPDEIDIPLRRIQREMQLHFPQKAIGLPPLTLSIGAAVIHDVTTQSAEEVVELADRCLYSAKEAGRNCAYKIELGGSNNDAPTKVCLTEEVGSHSN